MPKENLLSTVNSDQKLILTNISEEMEDSFISYAMNVIVSRALPDVRDGLKPVQRRILYAMFKLNINWRSSFKKSARIVGEVIGKYHPHGDSSVYQAMVRMAQNFSLRYPLIKGQGNFGSIDGDPPAAMRYTEVKMSRISEEMVRYLSKFNVEFRPNYDDSEEEPVFLTSFIPNLIINGSSGIAVGIATSIPPHNLKEVVKALIFLIKNPQATINDLMKFIPGPDFPGGASVYRSSSTIDSYLKGKGSVLLRAKFLVENETDKKTKIIFTHIPFKVNKSELLMKIDDLVSKKIIKGIYNLRDESSREEVRIVVTIAYGYNHQIILNQLFKHTNLQIVFYYNLVALVNNQPKLLNLKQLLNLFLNHQNKILISQTKFDINKTENRNKVLKGLEKSLAQIDLVVDLIRSSKSSKEAQTKLVVAIGITDQQAEVVMETKLSRLTSLEVKKIKDEILVNERNLSIWNNLLSSKQLQDQKIIDNLNKIGEIYGDNRLSNIIHDSPLESTGLDLIPNQNFILILTEKNYVKKLNCNLFKIQHRGGKGVYGIDRFKQVIKLVTEVNSHSKLYFFTNKGKVFTYPFYKIPSQTINAQGIPINNLIEIESDDDVCAVRALFDADFDRKDYFLTFLTKKGLVKKTKISDFKTVNRDGKIAIRLRSHDKLISVITISSNDFVVISSSIGRLCIFSNDEIKPQSRHAQGLKGINCGGGVATFLNKIDFKQEGFLLLMTNLGYGKKILLSLQKVNHRTNKGFVFIKQSSKVNNIIKFVCQVFNNKSILIATKQGKFIKVIASELSERKVKTALGTKILNLEFGDELRTAVLLQND